MKHCGWSCRMTPGALLHICAVFTCISLYRFLLLDVWVCVEFTKNFPITITKLLLAANIGNRRDSKQQQYCLINRTTINAEVNKKWRTIDCFGFDILNPFTSIHLTMPIYI
jgi:hypothetical protein